MKYSFKEIINIDKIQSLTKSFCEAIGIAAAIIDLDGKVLVSSGWQRICTEFHRKNPQTRQRCIESDTILANKMLEERKYAVYQCRNGLIDAVAPIVIEGDHIANLFIGQFLFKPADKEYFQKQADEYGFDKTCYLEALSKAPVISKKQIEPLLNFFSGFAEFLCEMGLKQIRQLKADEAQYESEKKYRIFFNNSIDAMLIIEGYIFTDCNNAALSMLKYNNKEEIINKHPSELSSEFQPDGKNSYKKANEMMDIAYKKGSHFFEWRHTQKNGDVLPIEISLTAIPMGKKKILHTIWRDISERKRAEEALLESEEKYRQLVKHAPSAIYEIDYQKDKFTNVNDVFCDYTGYSREELLSITPFDILTEDSKKHFNERLKKISTGEQVPEKVEFKIKRKNGQEIWVLLNMNFIFENGSLKKSAVIAHDITERKQAEDALRKSENQYKYLYRMVRLMCDNLPDLIWTKDLDNKFIFTNKAFCEQLLNAKDTDEPIGKTDMYFANREKESHPENPDYHTFGATCTDSDLAVLKSKKPKRTDEFGNVKGEFLYLDVYKAPFFDKKGGMIGTVGCAKDITKEKQIEKDHKQAEEALRQSEERLRIKLEYILSPDEDVKDVSLTDLVDLKDLQQIQDAFAAANDVASIISDVNGKPITKPSNFCGVCEIIRSTKKGNRNCIKSDKILGKKSKALMKPIYDECHSCGFIDASAPIIVGGKHIANWLIGQSNVMGVDKHRIETYAKEIDADKNEMLSAFEKMPEMSLAKFEERLDLLWIMAKEISTLGYSNIILAKDITELKQADYKLQKVHEELETRVKERTAELQTVNKELEAFSYSVSHDLRAPLRAIDGFSQVLLEDYTDILDEDGQRYLQRVRAGTQKMGQLIDDILNLSRIGRQPMVKETIKLENIAKETYKLLKNEWKDRKVNFSVHQCPSVQADSRLMQIVFTNLLSNALKFTRNKKAAKIEVGCKTKDGQNVFYVKDNGAGFDMKYVDKLFSPFQRLHSSEEYEGTGVGTAIVKRIINRHGGKIWVESKVDKGTVFYFTLNE